MADALTALLSEIRGCRLCVEAPSGKPLPHQPRPVVLAEAGARIGIFGQAPGTRVHASGIPFFDPSGDRLRQWMDVSNAEFYDTSRIAIVPMGFCFPGLDRKGGDLPPRRECAPQWRARVIEMMPDLQLVLLIGQYAQRWHLGAERGQTLTATVQAWRQIAARKDRPMRIALPHPSWRNNVWIKRNPWFETELLPVLRGEVRRLIGPRGRPA